MNSNRISNGTTEFAFFINWDTHQVFEYHRQDAITDGMFDNEGQPITHHSEAYRTHWQAEIALYREVIGLMAGTFAFLNENPEYAKHMKWDSLNAEMNAVLDGGKE